MILPRQWQRLNLRLLVAASRRTAWMWSCKSHHLCTHGTFLIAGTSSDTRKVSAWMSMRLSIRTGVCLSVCVHLCVRVCICASVSVRVHVCECLPVCVCVYLSASMTPFSHPPLTHTTRHNANTHLLCSWGKAVHDRAVCEAHRDC